eukprot:COSAG01_NODE_35943_length_525_cov_1.355294_1_plen_85_part_00
MAHRRKRHHPSLIACLQAASQPAVALSGRIASAAPLPLQYRTPFRHVPLTSSPAASGQLLLRFARLLSGGFPQPQPQPQPRDLG